MKITEQHKQVLLLFGSSIVGLALGVLNSVINTRALPPAQYGDFRYVQNIIAFLSNLLLLGYFVSGSRLLALSNDYNYSRRIRGAMCVILGVTIAIVMLVMTALCVANLCQGKGTMSQLYMAAIPVCGNVLMLNYINTVSQGDNQIGRISLARVLPSFVYCAAAFILFKIINVSPVNMLLLFNGISVITLLSIIISTKPSFHSLKESFSVLNEENRKYGFDVYLGSLANVPTAYISGITLGWFCDTNAEVGFYTLALTLAMPLSLLPSIVGTTYFKKFANRKDIDRRVIISSVILTLSSFVLFVLLIDIVVRFLYDDGYSSVSRYAAFLAIGTSMHGLGDLFSRFLCSQGRGKMLRNSAFMSGGMIVFGSFVFVYFFGIAGAVLTKIAGSAVYLLTMIIYYRRILHEEL